MMGKYQDSGSGVRRVQRWRRWGLLASAGLGLALVASSCGGTAGSGAPLLQSNTNWLQRCGPDAPCSGALLCLCGMCTQPCAEAAECGRLDGATCGGSCDGEAPSGGGLCVLGCTTDDDCGAEFTCQASECRPRPAALDERPLGDARVGTAGACSNAFVSLDDVFEHARQDLLSQDSADQPFLRYASLANHNNAGACLAELDAERLALSKALNSASLDSTLSRPVPIDADSLLYRIDLRDYVWDTPRTLDGVTYPDAWEMLALRTPSGLVFEGPAASELIERTATQLPLLQADALIRTITRAGPYRALLEQPETLDELLLELGLDLEANRADGNASRAATTQSRISRTHRVLERHELEVRAGVLWMTLDFLDGTVVNILQEPLRADSDGGSVTYTLPNGLPGFALYDQDGLLQDESDILLDTNQNNFRATPPISCMNCHTETVLPAADEAAAYAALNAEAFEPVERERIGQLYPDPVVLLGRMAGDNAAFRTAIESLGVSRGSADPVATLVFRYEQDMTRNDIVGDLMLAPGDADATLIALGIDSSLPREDFSRRLRELLCASLASASNQPADCNF